MNKLHLLFIFIVSLGLSSCGNDNDSANTDNDSTDTEPDDGGGDTDVDSSTDTEPDDSEDDTDVDSDPDEEDPQLGYEIIEILAADDMRVWVNHQMTPEEFDAIELPQGWVKNQPREGDPDGSTFLQSPDASGEGEFTYDEHFGHEWLYNAKIIEANTPVDDQGLLSLNRIVKFHVIWFNPGRTLTVLVSPEGESYVRVSRDANSTNDNPTIPDGWQLVEYVTPEKLVIQLPNPTDNIRADNEDSFQGPVTELENVFGD